VDGIDTESSESPGCILLWLRLGSASDPVVQAVVRRRLEGVNDADSENMFQYAAANLRKDSVVRWAL
jgi:hypothetical protein